MKERLNCCKARYICCVEDISVLDKLAEVERIYKKIILSKSSRRSIEMILWHAGDELFFKNEHEEAVLFYEKSIILMKELIAQNKDIEIYWRLAACHIKLKDYTRAINIVQEAMTISPNEAYNYYLLCLANLDLNSHSECMRLVKELPQLENFDFELMYSLALFAFSKSEYNIIHKCLVEIISTIQEKESNDDPILIQEKDVIDIFYYIKIAELYLFGLKVEEIDKYLQNNTEPQDNQQQDVLLLEINTLNKDSIIEIFVSILKGIGRLLGSANSNNNYMKDIQTEWLFAKAYRIGTLCFKQSSYLESAKLFAICVQFYEVSAMDKKNIRDYVSVLIMSAVSEIALTKAGAANNKERLLSPEKKELIKATIDKIKTKGKRTLKNNLQLQEQLFLVELEFCALACSWKSITCILENILPEAKSRFSVMTYERAANIIVQEDCPSATLVTILKELLECMLKNENMDMICFSKWMRLLISSALMTSKEGCFNYVRQAFLVISEDQNQYPNKEIEWLLAITWNTGLEFLETGEVEDAKKWCDMAVDLSAFMKNKDVYEGMQNAYSEILKSIALNID